MPDLAAPKPRGMTATAATAPMTTTAPGSSSVLLSPIDRLYVTVTVTATLADGTPATLTGVDVALLPVRTDPSSSTTWTAANYSAGAATVLLAGPAADPTGALAVPTGGADLWVRVTDTPEVQAVRAARVTVY